MIDSTTTDPLARSHEEAIRILIDGETPWDRRLIESSHWLNPILVKETRQALKSKQFFWTFMLLIVFAIAYTMFAVVSSIPNVYYDSDGSYFLFGYMVLLMLPSILVIPQVAFRSMSAELDDGTFETLSLSLLSPKQIVYGKLCVAVLQLIVYMSILAPCIALTYLLQGVTLEVIAALLSVNVVVSLFLSSIAIFMASVGRSRTMQIKFSVFLVLLQLFAIGCGFSVIGSLLLVQSLEREGWIGIALSSLAFCGYAWIALQCASSAIDMPSANRSTPVRVAVFLVGLAIAVLGVFTILSTSSGIRTDDLFGVVSSMCCIHWGISGAAMMGESGIVTARAQRTLPDSYFGRLFLTWFNPGAGPAYVLVLFSFVGPWLGVFGVLFLLSASFPRFTANLAPRSGIWIYIAALASYLALYLGLVRLILLAVFRQSRASRIILALALSLVLLIIAIFLSLLLSLVMGDFRSMDYDWYCFINPMWTLSELSEHVGSSVSIFSVRIGFISWLALTVSAGIVFLINALLTSRDTIVSRVETPPRVLAARPKQTSTDSMNNDPWSES